MKLENRKVAMLLSALIIAIISVTSALSYTPKAPSKLVQASNEFGFSLYKATNNETNLLFSPWSLSVVLSMVYLGSRNETATEMAEVLRLGNLLQEKEDIFNDYRDQSQQLTSGSVLSSNIALVQQGSNISQLYLSALQKYYDSEVTRVNFDDGESVLQLVNDLVSKATNGNIREILKNAPSPLTKLVLINSVYFKGTWEKMFNPNDTTPGVFYGVDNNTNIQMMHLKSKFYFVYDPISSSYTIDIPYQNKEMSLLIMMPTKSEKSLERLETYMSANFIEYIVRRLEKRYFELSLPKFRIEDSLDLRNVLTELGMASVFSPGYADLTGISEAGDLYLQDVYQKVTMEVSEEGTEASASSAAIIVSRIGAPKFMVDRPFFFVIRHKRTGLNLFVGRVLNM